MFKQKKLATGIAMGVLGVIGVAASVKAVYLNSDGTGQVLLFPYFNAQPGYVTNINLVNSTDQTKAIKVRIREGKNSNDVLNFNLYMPPADSWSGSLRMGENSEGEQVGTLVSRDRSCTIPETYTASCDGDCKIEQPFEGFKLIDAALNAADVREGYVEVIEMGVVSDASVQDAVSQRFTMPKDCADVAKAWEDGRFTSGYGAAATGLEAPSGGLFGSSAIVNVAKGTAFPVTPVALDHYSTQAQHYHPMKESEYLMPSLASGNVMQSSMTVKKPSGESELVVTQWNTSSDACTDAGAPSPCGNNPYPIAHALLAPYLLNEYHLDPTAGADNHTDWVVSFPMRHHALYSSSADVLTSVENSIFDEGGWSAEKLAGSYAGFAPPMGLPNTGDVGNQSVLGRGVNVLSMVSLDPSYDVERMALSSPHAQTLSVGAFINGWARLGFNGYDLAAGFKSAQGYGPSAVADEYNANSDIYKGIPVLGFAALEGSLGSDSPASGVTIPHRIKRN